MPERARQLYAAGLELFLERGYRDVDVDDIVASCNVSRGTFYGSFGNKRQLLEAILTRSFDDLVLAMFDNSDWSAVSDRDAYVAKFRSVLKRALQYIADHAALMSFVIMEAPGVDAAALESLLAGYRRTCARTSDVLTIAVQHGWMRSDVPIDLGWAGQMVVSCIAAAASPLLLGTGEKFDVDEVSDMCCAYLLGGMRAVLSTS